MEEIKTYNLTEKEFKNLEKLVEKIYNTLIVLNYAWLLALNVSARQGSPP